MHKWLAAILLCVVTAVQAASDPVLEARVMKLSEELRCLVCQNQSIAESNAELAVDLRRQVREMLAVGKSDDDVRAFMVERYGDFVLYEPPLKTSTLLLWLGPAALLLVALGAFLWHVRMRRQALAASPEAAELAQARALLENKDTA